MSPERGIYVPKEEETKDPITSKGMKEIEMEKERNGQRTTCSGPQGISDLGTGVSES